jgi:hypothetical protein
MVNKHFGVQQAATSGSDLPQIEHLRMQNAHVFLSHRRKARKGESPA